MKARRVGPWGSPITRRIFWHGRHPQSGAVLDVMKSRDGSRVMCFNQKMPEPDPEFLARSPCVRNCCLDDDLVCLGCFRSLSEIQEWSLVDESRRRIILDAARLRREQRELEISRRLAAS